MHVTDARMLTARLSGREMLEVGTEEHGTSSGLLFIVGAAGSAFGVIAPISRTVIRITLNQSPFWMWVDAVLWALWYSLLGFGFLGFHRRYGQESPLLVTLLALVTAVLQILTAFVISTSVEPTPVTLPVSMYVFGPGPTIVTLAIGGYSLIEMREQSKNKALMEGTGLALIIGGFGTVFTVIAMITSLSGVLALWLFVEEYRVRRYIPLMRSSQCS